MKIKFSLYAFLTGLYFATLQFCYLILLQVNVSSTYLTYMLVVLSWFTGTVAGLWMKRLTAPTSVFAGIISYYAVYALVSYQPFSPFTLLFAGLGVVITGLWAGRFFIAALSGFQNVDRLFFHENNGFFVGIILFFIGFTLLGRTFTLGAPIFLSLSILALNFILNKDSSPSEQEEMEEWNDGSKPSFLKTGT